MGFPIQRSPDLSLFSGSPKLIAAYRVFHRLLAPRHPPYALSSLTINSFTLMMPPSLYPYSIVKEQFLHASRIVLGSQIEKNEPTAENLSHPHMLVEMSGFEPPTPCVQGRCSPAELHPHPRQFRISRLTTLVGLDRFELSTSRLSGVRSNQLSYRPSP